VKFTLAWLKDHLETEATAAEIAQRLTGLGLEVESVADPARDLAPFTVAYVTAAKPHPNADRLTVCQVETGAGIVQVVCGAPNARAGMKGVFAPAGTRIPGTGLHLEKATIRGVESNGMLCSAREMGLGDDHEGIIELPADAALGAPFAAVIGRDDPVFDVAVTPDRADCLGVRGIARDLAAAGLGRLRPVDLGPVPGGFDSPVRWQRDLPPGAGDACPLVVGRYFRKLKNGPSPAWLRDRLAAIGLRPISALVDITNYVTYDLGRPLHMFDADALAGDPTMRFARPGEEILALDGRTYRLAVNNGPNHLHGGSKGFDKVVWQARSFTNHRGVAVAFSHTSPDGDEGYPGTLTAGVDYLLTDDDELVVEYEATTDAPTPVNLTHHSCFNLAGAGSGDILEHELTIAADSFIPVDSTLIPTGEIAAVAGTPFDFRTPVAIGARIGDQDEQLEYAGGYDHNFVLRSGGPGLVHAAHVAEPTTGRTLDVFTTEPGLHFYSGNFLDGTITGKSGYAYRRHAGFCLETQHYPDSPNQPRFPATILRPGERYRSRTMFAFGAS